MGTPQLRLFRGCHALGEEHAHGRMETSVHSQLDKGIPDFQGLPQALPGVQRAVQNEENFSFLSQNRKFLYELIGIEELF